MKLGAAIQTLEELELYLAGDTIACLICGKEFKSLGHHLRLSHAMGSKEYKIEFNIPVMRSLSGAALHARKSEILQNIWETNPAMEDVRERLKANVENLTNNFKGKKTSTITAKIDRERGVRMKAEEVERTRLKYRPIYLGYIEQAIAKGCTLYEVAKNTPSKNSVPIQHFADRWPDDREFNERLALVKKPNHAERGTGKETATCVCCGKSFTRWKNRKALAKTCSTVCGHKLREVRVITNCVVCGKEMSLTPANSERIKTCPSPACRGKRAIKLCVICGKKVSLRPYESELRSTCGSAACEVKMKLGSNNLITGEKQ